MNLIPAGSNNQELSVSDLYHILENKFKNKAVGFAFVISYKENFCTGSSGGFCRLQQDDHPRVMTVFEKYNCASVSKLVSSAALLLLLYRNEGVGLNSPMWEYLPSHWEIGTNIKTIKFKELLTHTSGFRTSVRSYDNLKQVIKDGININDKKDSYYNNTNYALLRLIIPKLADYSILSLKGMSESNIAAHEPTQAETFANDYIDYCRNNIFNKLASMPDISCTESTIQPPLFYDINDTAKTGRHMGDQRLNAGSGGWVMSTLQMAHLFRSIHHTEKIMPAALSKRMRDEHLGYGLEEIEGVTSYFKSGSENLDGREYSSLTMGFENGVQLDMMTTSDMGLKNLAWDAFKEWYH
jgi:CubicO group peptidase (beta-lactamase class C family)